MHVVTEYPDGIFSWVDLSSTDIDAAKTFYSGLFGWEAVDMPTDMGPPYTMFRIDGKSVAGAGPMPPGMPEGMPSYWTSYVNSKDVDAAVARATAAGGTVTMPPMDVMQEGRMAIIAAPDGSALGVWQARNHIGAQLVNMPNTLVWNELQTRDTEGTRAFFAAVFGWTSETDPNGYVMYRKDGRIHAGSMQIDEGWGDVPNNWAVYFHVEDVEAMVARAQELGGSVLVPPTPAGEMGLFAVLADPAGGAFTVMKFNGPVDPPPGA